MKLLRASLAVTCFLLAFAPCLAQSMSPVVTRVVDTHGNPIAGASVYIEQVASHAPPDIMKTDINGTFTTNIPHDARSETTVRCMVVAKGFAVGGKVLVNEGNHKIILTSQMQIHGKVVDVDLRPVVGATVQVLFLTYSDDGGIGIDVTGLGKRLTTKTDTRGEYTIGDLPRNAGIDVSINDPRFVSLDSETDAGVSKVPLLVATRGISLIGRVLLPNGKPAPGVRIQANNNVMGDGWQEQEAVSGNDGYYYITGLPAGEYYIIVDEPSDQKWDSHALDITAAAGRPTHVADIKLIPTKKKQD